MRAVVTMALFFPFYDGARRMAWVQRWSLRLLAILAVRIELGGAPPAAGAVRALIVANHVSWLDIFAINAVHKVRFVAKSEIRRWPVFGWLCAQGSALFIERASRHHTAHINEQVVAALRQGDTLVVFPEGYTSAGDVVLPFHASLLQPALACDAMLSPVAIRYTRADGSLCSEADYEGDKSMLGSLLLMLTQPVIYARLQFLPPIASAGMHRRELAHEAARLIARALDVPAPRRRSESIAGRKA
jgi:1-acyl-sn-glycerol-3-phosphate acyltransferase